MCETHSSERCALTAGLRSVMNVVDGGRATVERLTVTGAQSDDFGGAFYFGRGHGGGRFENVAFVACLAERAGGAVYVSNDANAGNVAFVGVNFTSNRVVAASSRGGAVYASTEGASRVTFDKCLFDGNDASGGFGGGLYAHGGRVVVNECNFTGNFAKTGGARRFEAVASSRRASSSITTRRKTSVVVYTSRRRRTSSTARTRARFRGVCFGIIAPCARAAASLRTDARACSPTNSLRMR